MQRLCMESAGRLLDFTADGKGPLNEEAATEQLEGAVAIHNILVDHKVAYLADEVGMGKTYVALGAMALLRHFNPSARILVIAPRENIQKKWIKELKNFVAGNVRFPDLIVKAAHGAPARAPVSCRNILELMRETVLDPDRDFFARMTSFSLALGHDIEGWTRLREQILPLVPWVDRHLFDLRDRERFKDSVGRAINAVIPTFDLVVVDEGHNLKHGLIQGGSTRNRLLSLAFGRPSAGVEDRTWRTYGARAQRVLFLSATPIEDDHTHLWNQLDVFGKASGFRDLIDGQDSEAKDKCAAQFLIRRIFALNLGGKRFTKNLYRREWRQGGVEDHDEPIAVVKPKELLVVALVQKKVSELLGHDRFGNNFQIGMLASFESFLQTAGVARHAEEGDGVFDDADQAQDLAARKGLDVHTVNRMAADYRRRFGRELPHPKMDGMVQQLSSSFETGMKTLVFVRRVASVHELRRKLNERYDDWIMKYMRDALRPELSADFSLVLDAYMQTRLSERKQRNVGLAEEELSPVDDPEDLRDMGGEDSFFAWYFRGQTPVPRMLSGGQFALRFNSAGAMLGTFFEDNHVAHVLDAPLGNVTEALCQMVGLDSSDLARELRIRAGLRLSGAKRQQRGTVFLAYQAAALSLIAEVSKSEIGRKASIVLEERFSHMPEHSQQSDAPALESRLETRTFWTELRRRPDLKSALWPEMHDAADFRTQFRERELRREMLSSMARLGHPLIDLYVSAVNASGTLRLGNRQQENADIDDVALIEGYLDVLDRQRHRNDSWTGYRELQSAAEQFDLILTTNEPEARKKPLHEVSRLVGRLLRAQEPVGGMSGQVNETMVRQFRMPGYPLVLVTTELLREGEDLHTFCSNVVHYGIAWMPSSLEQRVGRVDRVSSLTQRRLTKAGMVESNDMLQVYYPHLRDSVERVQVERVLRRQHDFMRLLHKGFGAVRSEKTIDIMRETTRASEPLQLDLEPMQTAYPVRPGMLVGRNKPLAVDPSFAVELGERFAKLPQILAQQIGAIKWEMDPPDGTLLGTVPRQHRVQPFTLLLRSTHGFPLIRCISPVGVYSEIQLHANALLRMAEQAGVRVCATPDPRLESYNLTIEGDVLLGRSDAIAANRIAWLLSSVTNAADRAEHLLLQMDQPMSRFRKQLETEVDVDR